VIAKKEFEELIEEFAGAVEDMVQATGTGFQAAVDEARAKLVKAFEDQCGLITDLLGRLTIKHEDDCRCAYCDELREMLLR
jgi:hypothetical protein